MNVNQAFPLLTLAAMAVVAMAVLPWALRGWRLTVPPSCRACGYDVSGRAGDSTRCSECGADLAIDGAVVTHFRRRRRTWAVVACGVMVTAVSVGIVGGSRLPWRAWWVGHAPSWMVRREARKDLWPGGDDFRGEWYRRDGASPELIDHLLDVQGNFAGPFAPSWDKVLADEAFRGNAMTTAQRQRYTRQLFVPPITLSVQQPLRASDDAQLVASFTKRVAYGFSSVGLQYQLTARADGPVETASLPWSNYLGFGGAFTRSLPNLTWAGPAMLTPGPHRLNILLRWRVVNGGSATQSTLDDAVSTKSSVALSVREGRRR